MTIARHSLVLMVNGASGVRPPIVTAVVVITRVVIVVVIIVGVDIVTTIVVMIPIRMTVVRMAIVAMMVDVQAVREPTYRECRCYTPEETVIEGVSRRLRIVVDRVCTRVVVISRL